MSDYLNRQSDPKRPHREALKDTASKVIRVDGDFTEAVWTMREREMNLQQKRRNAFVLKYRPVQTLDGLDPSPSRLRQRELAKGIALISAMLRPIGTYW